MAQRLTAYENYRTPRAHRNAVVLKRVLFEMADAFLPLFYLAFCRSDLNHLRIELIGLFCVDEFRRVFMEGED